MNAGARRLVEKLGLDPHPEGGYYRETYRASDMVSTPRGPRPASTAIYFLLPAGGVSRLHRIQSDEVWHFYEGGPLRVVELAGGEACETVLGPENPQHMVRACTWFGAYPEEGTEYSLVGCTVAPGFDFADFLLGERAELLRAFPKAGALVEKLTA